MSLKTKNISIVRGDTSRIGISVTNIPDETTISSLYFTIKRSKSDTMAVVQKSLDSGIASESTDDGIKYIVTLSPDDTQSLAARTYVYDVEMTINDDVYTILMGSCEVVADVTTRPLGVKS